MTFIDFYPIQIDEPCSIMHCFRNGHVATRDWKKGTVIKGSLSRIWLGDYDYIRAFRIHSKTHHRRVPWSVSPFDRATRKGIKRAKILRKNIEANVV